MPTIPFVVGAEDGASTSLQPTMHVDGVVSENAVNDLVAEQAHVSEIDVDDNGVAIGVSGVLSGVFPIEAASHHLQPLVSERRQERKEEHHD
jgi:hypothetical protein